MTSPTCPDCDAAVGEAHAELCDVQRCTVCLGQRLGCDCPGHQPEQARWTGEWPGVLECRELGWYAKLLPGRGWVACAPTDAGATEDLNRWAIEQHRKKVAAGR